jgi:hypothetical protein
LWGLCNFILPTFTVEDAAINELSSFRKRPDHGRKKAQTTRYGHREYVGLIGEAGKSLGAGIQVISYHL